MSAKERAALDERRSAVGALAEVIAGVPAPNLRPGYLNFPSGQKLRAAIIEAPAILSLSSARDDFLGLIYNYRWSAFVERPLCQERFRPLVIDLSRAQHLDLDAALVLTSEYHRTLLLNPNFYPPIDDAGWPAEIRGLLESLGFYDLVKANSRTGTSSKLNSALQFVRFLSDERVEGQVAGQLIDSLRDIAGREPEREYTYVALLEAINNVRDHAYPPDKPPQVFPTVPRWWIAGSYNPASETLQFAVYDQGVGIPATLPRRSFFKSILRLCPIEWNDADVIEGGIRFGRSRFLRKPHPTHEDVSGRGNGLWTICKLIPQLPGSNVRIVSGKGEVIYSQRRSIKKTIHKNTFCGTLVEWTLKFPSAALIEGSRI